MHAWKRYLSFTWILIFGFNFHECNYSYCWWCWASLLRYARLKCTSCCILNTGWIIKCCFLCWQPISIPDGAQHSTYLPRKTISKLNMRFRKTGTLAYSFDSICIHQKTGFYQSWISAVDLPSLIWSLLPQLTFDSGSLSNLGRKSLQSSLICTTSQTRYSSTRSPTWRWVWW